MKRRAQRRSSAFTARTYAMALAAFACVATSCAATATHVAIRHPATASGHASLACDYYGVVIAAGLISRDHGGRNLRTSIVRREWLLLLRKGEEVQTRLKRAPRRMRLLAKRYASVLATLRSANDALQQGAFALYAKRMSAAAPELNALRPAERIAQLRCTQKSRSGTITFGPG